MGKVVDKLWDFAMGDDTPEQFATNYVKEKWGSVRCPLHKRTEEQLYQHMLLLGGSGCGKTTMFQMGLIKNIALAKKGKCSIVHIDPVQANDELIAHANVEMYKNAILIDVAKPDSLPCLDIFETSSEVDPRVRTSNLIGVFVAVCSGLVEQALTAQMKTLFSYCAQVAVRMEQPGLYDLLVLLSKPMEVLESLGFTPDDTTYQFFAEELANTGKGRSPMKETATSLRSRIHGVLADPIVKRLFSTGSPTLSLTKAINEGSMIFVATRKGFLTADGARLLGNYILTLTHRAMQERVSTPREQMMPTHLYYDEVQNSFSGGYNEILAEMLDEDRKYKLSVNVATTRFGHISTEMADAFLSCIETKVIGKMSTRGAQLIAQEMFPGSRKAMDNLLTLENYEFWCRIRSVHKQAVKIKSVKDPLKKIGPARPHAIENFHARMALKYGQFRLDQQELLEAEEVEKIEVRKVAPKIVQPVSAKKDVLSNVEHM